MTDAPREFGPARVATHDGVLRLYFAPLRTAVSTFMLALFGASCCVIGLAAISGLARSGSSPAASLLAFAFAGVFAVPLLAMGALFLGLAIWSACNSLTVMVSTAGICSERRWLGFLLARRSLARSEIAALEVRLAPRFVGVLGAGRYRTLHARGSARDLLIADALKNSELAEAMRLLVTEQLQMPALMKRVDAP